MAAASHKAPMAVRAPMRAAQRDAPRRRPIRRLWRSGRRSAGAYGAERAGAALGSISGAPYASPRPDRASAAAPLWGAPYRRPLWGHMARAPMAPTTCTCNYNAKYPYMLGNLGGSVRNYSIGGKIRFLIGPLGGENANRIKGLAHYSTVPVIVHYRSPAVKGFRRARARPANLPTCQPILNTLHSYFPTLYRALFPYYK